MDLPEFEFSAFISYRHLDAVEPGRQWAAWVQNVLERYTTPPELAGQPSLYGDTVPPDMARVFRDKDQIPAHGDLGALIHDALERSRVLIVLCTPAAVASPWVADEILHFKKLGRADRIIAIVLHGKPHAFDPAEECYPEPLRYKLLPDGTLDRTQKEHPIYIDLRPPLGTHGGTTPEEYRTILQQADEWKEARIEQAVVKHAQLLEEARILLLSGALGLAPRDLSQRDLLRRIEEEKQRAADAAQRAAWEAGQKQIAETARAEAEAARVQAEEARVQAEEARVQAEEALAAADCARREAVQSREAAECEQRAAEQARADEQRQREQAQRAQRTSRALAIAATVLACAAIAAALWAFAMRAAAERERKDALRARALAVEQEKVAREERVTAIKSQQEAAQARADAEKLVIYLSYNLIGELTDPAKLMQHANQLVAKYFADHPPAPDASPESRDLYDRERAVTFNQAGDIARMAKKLDEARQAYNQAVDIRQRLVDKDPTNTDWQRLLSITLDGLAAVETMEGHRDAAFADLSKAKGIRQMLADQQAEPLYAIDLAYIDAHLARHYLQGMPPDQSAAQPLISDGLARMKAVESAAESDSYYQGVLADLQSLVSLISKPQ